MADWKALVRSRLASLRMTASAESELADELAEHLEDQYRELRSGGTSHEEAYRRTIAELDDTYPLGAGMDRSQRMPAHELVPAGDARRGRFMDDLWRDLRYAGRTMRTSPLFVLFVVVTLGLGIGANTTVFTLIRTLILNPLPVHEINELAAIATGDAAGTSQSSAPLPISYPNLQGRAGTRWGSAFRCPEKSRCARLWASPGRPTTPAGERRRNGASMCRSNRTTCLR